MIVPLGSVDPYTSPVELKCHVIPLRELVSRSSQVCQITHFTLSLGHCLSEVFVDRIVLRI